MEAGIGVGVSEVIGVGRSEVVGVRVVVNVVIEEERGYTEALWCTRGHVSVWAGGVVVAVTGHPPLEVGGQPTHCVVSERGVLERS